MDRRRERRQGGVSFPEILAVLGLAGLLALAAMPFFHRGREARRLGLTAHTLASELTSARWSAVQGNDDRRVEISADGVLQVLDSRSALLRSRNLDPRVRWMTSAEVQGAGLPAPEGGLPAVPPEASATFLYSAAGTAPVGEVRTAYLRNAFGEIAAVSVNSTGAPRVWRWRGSGWSS